MVVCGENSIPSFVEKNPTCKSPCPWAYWQWFLSGLAVLASARFTLNGEYGTDCALRPESSSDTAPHVCGLMDARVDSTT